MLESHEHFLRSIDLENSRVQNQPSRIFLCGGKYSGAAPIKSARHFLLAKLLELRHPLSERIMLADDINNWFDGGIFNDLLELESSIARLCSIIVLFAESPGSFAELGAFAL